MDLIISLLVALLLFFIAWAVGGILFFALICLAGSSPLPKELDHNKEKNNDN